MRRLVAFCVVLAAAAAAPYARGVEPNKQRCLAANDAGQDLKRARKLLEAREKLSVCAAASCPALVRQDCAQWLNDVNATMPSLVFEAKDGNGNDLSAVKVTMDGQPFADKLDGSSLEVDPGEHRFTFDGADGLTHVEKTIVVREGDRNRRERVTLGASSPVPAGATSSTAPSDGSTQRTIGYVVGGVGAVGLVVGSIFGVMSLSGSPCDSGSKTCATQADHDTLSTHEMIANVGLGVGVVGLVVGGFLVFTSSGGDSSKNSASTSIAPWIGWGSAGVAGSFQ